MIFSRSMTFDDEDMSGVPATRPTDALQNAESLFIERLRSGDAAAFEQLIERHSGEIFSLLFRLTQDREEAQDLTQETFLSAVRSIGGFRGDADLKTWLYRIAVNHSRNRFRWWKRRQGPNTVSLDEPLGIDSSATIGDTLAAKSADPEQTALQSERKAAIADVLADMHESYREAVVLCDIEGLSYEEIAGALEISIGTVKSRIARGREELRRKLKGF